MFLSALVSMIHFIFIHINTFHINKKIYIKQHIISMKCVVGPMTYRNIIVICWPITAEGGGWEQNYNRLRK